MPKLKILPISILLVGSLLTLTGSFIVLSQEPPQAPKVVFSVDVEVVNVFVTVRDKKGNIVRDLTQEDFTLSEDGQKQTIRYFSRETDLPLTIGLIVDTTPSESNMLEEEKAASRAFLNSMLRPDKDKAFLIQFGNEVELLQDLTSSPEELERALGLLERHSLGFAGRKIAGPGRRGGGGQTGGFDSLNTILADAVYLASDEIMKPQEGRKALIILGDGYHIGDRGEMAIAAAQQSDTLIYTIRIYDKEFGASPGGWGGMGPFPPFGGPGGWPGNSDWKENLKMLSRQTGGAYFEVTKKETLEQIYGKIEEELRSQYSLGYTPENKARTGYRKIKIGVQKKGMIVHGREGYYARKKK